MLARGTAYSKAFPWFLVRPLSTFRHVEQGDGTGTASSALHGAEAPPPGLRGGGPRSGRGKDRDHVGDDLERDRELLVDAPRGFTVDLPIYASNIVGPLL